MLQGSVAPADGYVTCSKMLVLECRCGEKLVLLGRKGGWYREGRTDFECGSCGGKLSLEDGH